MRLQNAVGHGASAALVRGERRRLLRHAAAEEYAANYAAVRADMEREIAELIRKAGEEE